MATKESEVKHVLQFCKLASLLACLLACVWDLLKTSYFLSWDTSTCGECFVLLPTMEDTTSMRFHGRFVCPKIRPSAFHQVLFVGPTAGLMLSSMAIHAVCRDDRLLQRHHLGNGSKKTPGRCVSASCRWGCKPYKWPYKWVPSLKLT